LGSAEPKIDDKSVISKRCPVTGSAMTNQQYLRRNGEISAYEALWIPIFTGLEIVLVTVFNK